MRRKACRGFAAALLTTIAAAPASGSSTLFDPALRFRTIRTDHFRIHFHQQSDALAARLAIIAEDVWHQLERPLGLRPPRLTQVVIADQTELPNAYATPLPYDTVVIYPTWPVGAEFDVDDWLRVVFTHEFTHIVHLDRSESWARVVRGVFGRIDVAFPNLFLPTWQVEGLAVYEETALTGEGRLRAGDFRAVVDEAARSRAALPLDRANGGLTAWPSGLAPYAYGAAFHEYLSDRFGVDTLAQLADATARRVPYTASRVFPRIFGESLGQLWRDFEAKRASDPATAAGDDGASHVTRITHHGFVSAAPRFDRSCAGCPAEIVYTKRTPDGFPSLNRIRPEREGFSRASKLANRYFGTTTGIARDALYFDQLEVHRNVALYGDLYRMDRASGHVSRLTWGARLHDPDLSPDGETLVAVQEKTGTRDVVLVRVTPTAGAVRPKAETTTLVSEADTQFNAPRWSPDGNRIAVERHRLGSDPEVVIVDVATRAVRVAASRERTRVVMPAWRPDGRAIIAAVAPDDQPFNLIEFDLDSHRSRQLTHTTGGATWPDVSADGKTLLFVGYTADGYDLFSMPYPDVRGEEVSRDEQLEKQRDEHSRAARVSQSAPSVTAASDYSPIGTLKPTSWTPIIESDSTQTRIGAATGGFDVLGYHAYAASATWLISSPSDAIKPSAATPDWSIAYAYARWRFTPFVSASSDTTFFAGPATAAGTPSTATRRERDVETGVVLPFIRVRHSHSAFASFLRAADEYTLTDRTLSRDRNAIRAAWTTTTARTYGYSISPEDGIATGATGEWVRTAFGASADATTTTGDFRAYLPGLALHHVVAARMAGGVSSGDPIVGRTFVLGGPASDANVVDFGSGAASLLRGFASNSFAGSRVALLNLEYRFPIVRPQRGVGTWPIFLHTIHAAGFVDAGHAWTRAFDARSIKTSIGAELSANVVAGFYVPFTATVGVARGHDGSGTLRDGTRVYFRVGKSF